MQNYYPKHCGIRSPLTGRAVKDASLFDGGRGNNLRTKFERGLLFVHALYAYIAAPFLGAGVCCALIVRCAFWFCALVIEGLRPSNSPQAFREKLDQKLYSRHSLLDAQVCCREWFDSGSSPWQATKIVHFCCLYFFFGL